MVSRSRYSCVKYTTTAVNKPTEHGGYSTPGLTSTFRYSMRILTIGGLFSHHVGVVVITIVPFQTFNLFLQFLLFGKSLFFGMPYKKSSSKLQHPPTCPLGNPGTFDRRPCQRWGTWVIIWTESVKSFQCNTHVFMKEFIGKELSRASGLQWQFSHCRMMLTCRRKTQQQHQKLRHDFVKFYNICWSHKELLNIGQGIWT